MKNKEPWYGIKCVFRHADMKTELAGASLFEERIVLVTADNEDEAIAAAEVDARSYAEDTGCEYLEFASCFHSFDEKIVHLSEVYSIMRESTLDPSEYLNHFYDTGKERDRK